MVVWRPSTKITKTKLMRLNQIWPPGGVASFPYALIMQNHLQCEYSENSQNWIQIDGNFFY